MQPTMTEYTQPFSPLRPEGDRSASMALFFSPLRQQRLQSVGEQLRDTRRAGIATRHNSLPAFHRNTMVWPGVEDPVPT